MRLLAVLVLVGCGARPSPPPLIANRAPPTPRPRCEVAEVAAELRARWNVDRVDVDCTPGRFPAPGFFIEARAGARHVTGIVDAETLREVAPFVDEPARDPRISTIQRASTDLDGDGVDEIVETWRDSAHARTGVANRVVVRRVEARHLELIDGPHAGVFHPDLGSCQAEARIDERGQLVVHVMRIVGIPPSDCLSPGLHHFVLDRGAVVQTRSSRW